MILDLQPFIAPYQKFTYLVIDIATLNEDDQIITKIHPEDQPAYFLFSTVRDGYEGSKKRFHFITDGLGWQKVAIRPTDPIPYLDNYPPQFDDLSPDPGIVRECIKRFIDGTIYSACLDLGLIIWGDIL